MKNLWLNSYQGAIGIITLAFLAPHSDSVQAQTTNVSALKTHFFRGPPLTTQEVDYVVRLAKECGLEQPESVADRRVLPDLKSIPRSLIVTSVESVQDRKSFRSWVKVDCTNWSSKTMNSRAKQLDKFYVNQPYLHTDEATLAKFGTNIIRLSLASDIPLDVADAILDAFARGELKFLKPELRSDWGLVRNPDPSGLFKSGKDYVIDFGKPPRRSVGLTYTKKQVVITGVFEIDY